MTWALGLNPAPTGDEIVLYDAVADETAGVIYEINAYNDQDSTASLERNLILVKRNLNSGEVISYKELSRGYQITPETSAPVRIKLEEGDSADDTYLWIMWTEQRSPSVQSWILGKFTTDGDSVFSVEGNSYANDFLWDDTNVYVQFSHATKAKLVSRNKTTGTQNWCVESGYEYTFGTGMAQDTNYIYWSEYDYNSLGDGFQYVKRLSKIYKPTGSSSWTKVWSSGGNTAGQVVIDSSGDLYWRNNANILKLDTSGNPIWYKSYQEMGVGGTLAVWYGGSAEDRIIFHKDIVYSNGGMDRLSQIYSIDNDGDVVWAYRYSTNNTDDRFTGHNISTSANYILDCASWGSSGEVPGIWSRLQRFDPQTGSPTWTNQPLGLGSTQSHEERNPSVTTNSNPSLATGANPVTTASDPTFVRLSPGTLYDFTTLGIASFNDIKWWNAIQGATTITSSATLSETSGYLLDGNSAITSQTSVTPTATNSISSSSSIACDAQITPSAGNIVGFPDTLGDVEYVDDDYAGDQYTLNARTYVEEGYGEGGYFAYEMVPVFDRQMRQDLNWDAQTDFLGGYKVGAEADIISDSQSNMAGGLLFDETVNLDSNTQSTFSGGRIRQGDTDLASDFTTTGLGGNSIVAQGSFLATTQFSPIGIVEIVPDANVFADAQIEITGGYTVFSGSLTLGSQGELGITFDSGTSAGVIIDNSSSISSEFALSETVENVIDSANSFASDFALTETSGYLHAGEGLLVSDATWTPTLPSIIEANQMFGASTFATNFSGGRLRQGEADLQAQLIFEPEALRIPVPEPYRTYTVKTETRTNTIEQETRVFDVKSETRINNITTESRVYLVPSETRTLEVLPDLTIRQVAGRRVGERV